MKSLTPGDEKFLCDVLDKVMDGDVHIATKFVSPTFVIRITRPKGQERGVFHGVLTIGRPNARERDFIKSCKAAKEPFPVKGVILKFHPEKKKKK